MDVFDANATCFVGGTVGLLNDDSAITSVTPVLQYDTAESYLCVEVEVDWVDKFGVVVTGVAKEVILI